MVNEEIGIAASHIPTVASGKYEIKANLQNNLSNIQEQEIVFYVAGYQYTIPQNEVLAMYPPTEHTGDFAGTFPHIQFRRSTLPWEFNCESNGKKIPYIFLVILKEDELASGDFEIMETSTNDLMDSLEDPEEPKPLKILKALKGNEELFPSIDFVSQLAHVRVQEHVELKDLNLPKETSILIAHRMVEPTTKYKAFVCYYSTEVITKEKDKYQLNNSNKKNEYQKTSSCVILSEWSFESINTQLYQIDTNKLKNHPEFQTFQKDLIDSEVLTLEELKRKANAELNNLISINETYLEECRLRWAKLPEPKSIDDFERTEVNSFKKVNNYILEYLKYNGKNLKGYLSELKLQPFKAEINIQNKAIINLVDAAKVPLEHQLKGGGKIVSWYQGPFTNWNYSFNLGDFLKDKEWVDIPDHPDYLNLFNDDTKMYDMTYAAAWQLGRLIIMNDNKMLQELKKWKNDLQLHNLIQEQNQYSHLPSLKTQAPQVSDLLLNFVTALIQFRNFPLYYLLPHADLSTEESIKYFRIDNSWMLAFLYGIFSAGPKLSIIDFEEYILNNKDLSGIFDYTKPLYGILLQSQIIKNWPHIVVELDNRIDFHYVTSISNTLRLYITDQKFSGIKLYLKNENANFGKEYSDEAEKFITLSSDNIKLANIHLHKQPKLRLKLN
ncbi:hypothetical protein OF897_21290 [Chryseobacterium formosus]|uniref:Uncharacterized protein n=1 Tax=Chryseobacterium formosus TaxID=1537363 RepID=A0ABT3XXQ7_9FLAO|nr:hypothetical protein [Chryseobacterium formosus]MCX8526456.1 hypothetical protein [Chryseobacterium formosus]